MKNKNFYSEQKAKCGYPGCSYKSIRRLLKRHTLNVHNGPVIEASNISNFISKFKHIS